MGIHGILSNSIQHPGLSGKPHYTKD